MSPEKKGRKNSLVNIGVNPRPPPKNSAGILEVDHDHRFEVVSLRHTHQITGKKGS